MNENEIKDIIEKESTRSIMIFLERNETDLWPRRLPRANPKFEDEPEGSSFITKDNLNFSVTPTMNDGSVADWDVERSRENLLEGFTWYSIGTFRGDGTQVGVWSDPILIKIGRDGVDGTPGTDGNPGKDGRDGVDGAAIEYIYYLCANQEEFDSLRNPDPPVDPRYPDDPSPEHADETGWCPTDEGWTPSPQGIDSTHKIEAMCYRKLSLATNKWTTCFGPYKWSVWGNNGKDGDGVEYVYITVDRSCMLQNEDVMDETICRQMNIWPPTNPNNPDDALIINSSEYQSTDREYVPNGWFDEPQDVTFLKPYQFVSVRKYNGSTKRWGPFSEPSLWNKRILADKSFTIYRSFETYEVPATPGVDGWGGWWDVQENILMDVPDGWTTVPPTTATYNWASGASFESSEGKQITRWSPPQQINTIDLTIESVTRWFQANNQETGVEAPNTDVDPYTVGWSVEVPTINNENPYLWGFDRYIYTDGSIWQTVPCIIRYFNAEAQVTFEQVQEFIQNEINNELEDSNKRLGQISETESTITSQGGLTQILNSYNDENHKKAFADIVANAADATIKLKAASEISDELTTAGTTLNGIKGNVTTVVSQLSGMPETAGCVKGAIQDVGVEAITSAVTKGQYCWVALQNATISGQSVVKGNSYPYGSTESGVTKRNTDESFENYETRILAITSGGNPVFEKKLTSQEMSTIKQESHKISLLVGENGQPSAALQIIASSDVQGSQIILDADNIVLDGSVIATSLSAGNITIQGSGSSTITQIGNNGIRTNNAIIDGNICSHLGFFGDYEVGNDWSIVGKNGVSIDGSGLRSVKNSTSFINADGNTGFYLTGDDFCFRTGNSVFSRDLIKLDGDIIAKSLSAESSEFSTKIEPGKFIIKLGAEEVAWFMVDPDDPRYVRLRFLGANGMCDITGNGVITVSDIDKQPNYFTEFGPIMLCNWTSVIPISLDDAPAGSSINTDRAEWYTTAFENTSNYFRYFNGWKSISGVKYYYNPDDKTTSGGYNLSEQSRWHYSYMLSETVPGTTIPDGTYISEPEFAGRPASLDAEFPNNLFFSFYYYTFEDGKLVSQENVLFTYWGPGSPDPSTTREYVTGVRVLTVKNPSTI